MPSKYLVTVPVSDTTGSGASLQITSFENMVITPFGEAIRSIGVPVATMCLNARDIGNLLVMAVGPTPVGQIGSQPYTAGGSAITFETARAFSETGLTFSITGDAAGTIDPATGIVTVDGLAATSTFTITGTNAQGSTTQDVEVFVTQPAATTPVNSVTHNGVTFTFDQTLQLAYSCIGDPIVVSDQAFNIISITPVSEGVTGANGVFDAHGAMKNPGDLFLNNGQGFDGLIGESDAPGQGSSNTQYISSLNVDPNINGPIPIAAGEIGTIVKSVRRAGMTETGDWQTIDFYVPLTILSEVPPEGFFRPGLAPGVKDVEFVEGQVRYDVLRSLPTLAGVDDQAEAEAGIPVMSPMFGISNGDKLRRFNVHGGSNYSRDIAFGYADAHAFLHTNVTDAEKRLTLLRSIQIGIDIAQAQTNGYTGFGGAGQNYGRSFYSYVAGFALTSNKLLQQAQAMGGAALRQHFWAEADTHHKPALWPSNDKDRYNYPLLDSDLNIPEWDRNSVDETKRDAAINARYRSMWPAGMMEAINVLLLQNGPNGESGYEAIWAGGPQDFTNDAGASVAYYDRMRAVPDASIDQAFAFFTDKKARWDTWRPLIGAPLWTGRPEFVFEDGNVTAGDGSIDYLFAQRIWATEPVTQTELQYSLDTVQWIDAPNTTPDGTLANMTNGFEHYVRVRFTSASGTGRWSTTWPTVQPDPYTPGDPLSFKNAATPAGTDVASAPANVVLPCLCVPEFDNWPGADRIPVGASYTTQQLDDEVLLHAGVGYWTGFPVPTFSFQWQSDGVDIAGATESTFSPKNLFTLSETAITCVVTATGSSAVSATTPPVQMPVIAPPPPFVIDFATDQSAGWTAFNGGTLSYNAPFERLQNVLSGSFAGISSPAIPVVSGVEHTLTITTESDAGGDHQFRIGSTVGNDNIHESANLDGHGTYTVDFTPNADDVFVTFFRRGTATGSTISVKTVSVGQKV